MGRDEEQKLIYTKFKIKILNERGKRTNYKKKHTRKKKKKNM